MGGRFPLLQQRQQILASSFHFFFFFEDGLSTTVQDFSMWSTVSYYVISHPSPSLVLLTTSKHQDSLLWGHRNQGKDGRKKTYHLQPVPATSPKSSAAASHLLYCSVISFCWRSSTELQEYWFQTSYRWIQSLPAKCQITRPLVAKPQAPVILSQHCQAALLRAAPGKQHKEPCLPMEKSIIQIFFCLLFTLVLHTLPHVSFKSHAWLKNKQAKRLHPQAQSSYCRTSFNPTKYSHCSEIINITAFSLALLSEFISEVPKLCG